MDSDDIMVALVEGRVQTLLIHDDGSGQTDDPTDQLEPRKADRAIAAALSTDAEIMVVPRRDEWPRHGCCDELVVAAGAHAPVLAAFGSPAGRRVGRDR